jgi:hypothetical protein
MIGVLIAILSREFNMRCGSKIHIKLGPQQADPGHAFLAASFRL